MDMEYFKRQIKEELEGAKSYAKRAIEIKPMNVSWGKQFIIMANAEIDHATKLNSMMQELYSIMKGAYSEMPEYVEKTYHDAVEIFTEGMSKVKYILDMYTK